MKKKLLLFLSALIGLGGSSALALEPTDDGIYEIGSAEDLVAFSDLVNAGNYGLNAILTADIDMSSVENFTPIGHFGNGADDKYYGTFDGRGHKISHLTAVFPEASDVGLFNTGGDNTHVVIKNLWLDETCYIEGLHRVGLIGNHNHGEATFENLGNLGKVKGNSDNTSMLIGRAWSQSGNVVEVKNCWTIGEVETSGAGSGLCSWASGSCTYKFSNCWTAAEVTATGSTTVVRMQNAGGVVFENTFAAGVKQEGVNYFLKEDVANGGLCYYINLAVEEPVWFQTIGTDPYPVVDSSHGLVYLTEGIGCDGRAKGDVPFGNTDLGISAEPDSHNIVDGLCSVCGQLPQAEDGYYEIASGPALAKFSEMVNEGMVQINGRLTADIDMSGIDFMPIGLFGDNSPLKLSYYGTLDGGKHIISNLYISTDEWYEAGLISRAYNATVKDLGIVDATIESNNLNGRIGAIAGLNRNSNFINCWSAGNLRFTCTDESVESPQIGGIFGNTNNTAVCTDCWSTYEGTLGTGGGKLTNCIGYEDNPNIAEDAVSGVLCYTLNNGSFTDVKWFQRVGEDTYPCQNEERGIVYKTNAGYSTLLPEDGASFTAFRDNTVEFEKEFAEEAVACQALLDKYKLQIEGLKDIENFEAFCEEYSKLYELRQSIEASIAAYEAYAATCQAAIVYLTENEFTNETRTLLEKYLNTEVEPNETFVHGSYPYIMEQHELNDQEIAAEAAYVEIMLQKAISGGFVPGTDISVLITNSDFKDDLNGWTVESAGGSVTTGGEESIMKLVQGQNSVFSVEQTLSEIPNGIYMISANAFSRPFNDYYSFLNTGQLYLNGNSNFVMTISEDVITTDDAQDGVNCHLTGEGTDDKYEEDVEGYVPASLVGASYAFGGGRYMNYAAVEVTEGALTLGVRNLGSGIEGDWLPFGGLRVVFLGSAEEASESLANVLKSYRDRGENILDFIMSDGMDYAKYPNMSAALKINIESTLSESEADGLTGEQMMAFINKFSELFNDVYNCRKAYVAVFRAAENLMDQAEALVELIESEYYETALTAAGAALQAYQEGSMTTEEAWAKVAELEEMTNSLGGLHKDEDDFYLIADAHDLVLFSVIVNEGDLDANAKLTNDIDMSSVDNFTGIGVARNSLYTGTFDGQGHKISGMTISYPGKEDVGFFHIAKATLKNFWLDETCLIEGEKGVALVGWCNGDSPQFENIGVAAQIKGGENTSSFIGRAWKNPQFKNCWSIGEIDNSVGGGTKTNTGVFMGWCNTWGGSFTNCWTTATFAIAPADGNYLTRKGDNVIFNNTYSLYGSQASRMTEDDVTSGALCFKLNGDQSEITWYQTIGEDAHPVLDSTHGIVYLAVDQFCDGTPKGDPVYSNTAGGTRDDHVYEDGICKVCGAYDPNLIIDGVYQIGLPVQLVWFSDYVNTKDNYANARLTADIDMSSVENFTPIGLYGDGAAIKKNYYGTFDGARHIISNLTVNTDEKFEAGLFGRVYKATVKDLGIENATITSNDKNGRIGAIAGFNRESTFINCWSAGTLTLTCTDETVESPQIGGIFGNTNNTAICTNCWSTYEGALGTGEGTLTNCYSYAEDPDIAAKAASGALCFALNQGAGETIYYQLIGEDLHPVFDESRGEVILNGDGTYTGIEMLTADPGQVVTIYDLSGRKIVNGKWSNGKLPKGVYIVNGRKVLLK